MTKSRPKIIGALIKNNDFDFAFLTESWLRSEPDNTVSNNEIDIENYNIYRADRKHIVHGGVCAYVKQNYRCEQMLSYSDTANELLILKIDQINSLLIIVYRPPKANGNSFKEVVRLIKNETDKVRHDTNIYLCGDFN